MGWLERPSPGLDTAAAVTLPSNGITEIQSASQAEEELRPFAGRFAYTLFSLGIVGKGLLAILVLAGSAAYAIGEGVEWPIGPAPKLIEAMGFYLVLTAAILIGLALNLPFVPSRFHLEPIRALVVSAIINGITAVP